MNEQLVHETLAYQYQGVPGLLSICSDADKWVGRRFPTDAAGIAAATAYVLQLDKRRPKGIYTQVTTLREDPAKGRGGKDLAHTITWLWADGDFGDIGHKPGADELPHPVDADHVREIVASSGLPEPTGWVYSGGGCNPVWMLDEPFVLTDETARAAAEELTSALQAILGATAYGFGCTWDTQVGNLDRLMRLPGTVNRKGGQERATSSVVGSSESVAIDAMREIVARLEPDARAILEKAAAEKRARQDERTGRAPVPPPRTPRPASGPGASVFDILANGLSFRDILEPAGWTYRGTTGRREKWLRPAGAEGAADSDYSLVCDDHVAVNWSTQSGLPSGQQPPGQKLTVPTLWAHLHYGGNEREAALDVLRAAFDQDAGPAARALPPQILAEVRQHCRPPRAEQPPPPPPAEDMWGDLEEPEPEHHRPGDEDAGPKVRPGLLPEEFWAARPELRAIRQAAHSRNRSGDVAFYATLSRLSGMIPHHIRADTGVADFVSLNLFAAIVGPSGAGKSTGVQVGKRLLTSPAAMDFRDGLPIGSGEGMAEVFMGTKEEETGEIHKGGPKKGDPVTVSVRAQVRHNAFFYIDEGASLTRLMKERSGSTLGETLRSAAVGQTLGQTNATKDNSRYIPGGSYSLGLLVGFQPETAAPLFDEVAEGTPQRFLWGLVIDPSIPDEPCPWPGELTDWRLAITTDGTRLITEPTHITFDAQITTELRRIDLANARGETRADDVGPLDSHAPVMKIKVSSLLAILGGRRHVTLDDWSLAEMVWRTSCAARDYVLAYAERKRLVEAEKRTQARIEEELRIDQARVAQDEARADKAVDRVSVRLAVLVHDAGGATRTALRPKFAGRDKKHISNAIDLAIARAWVVERDGKLAPGPSRPT